MEKELQIKIAQIEARIRVLLGRQNVNTLVLQLLVAQSPEVMRSLHRLTPEKAEDILLFRAMEDETILHALDQLALFRDLSVASP